MLMLPLSFYIAFSLAVFLLREWRKGGEWSLTRQTFGWLVGVCIVHAVLVGLVWTYGFAAFRPALPVTASLLPMLVWAGFRTMLRPAPQITPATMVALMAPTLTIAVSIAVFPDVIDPLLIVIYLAYGVALWRMAHAGPDALQATRLHYSAQSHLAMRGVATALILNAVVDVAVFVDFQFYAGRHVPGILSVLSLLNLIAIGGLALMASEGGSNDVEDAGEPVADTSDNDADTVRQVEALLRETQLYADPDLTLIRIARKVGIPARGISAAINRHHGMNVSQYVNGFRLREACRLLAETELSITEVHLDAGFQTKSNFNREFRRQFDISPTEWRTAHRASAATRQKKLPAAGMPGQQSGRT